MRRSDFTRLQNEEPRWKCLYLKVDMWSWNIERAEPTGQKRVNPNFPGGQPLGIFEEYVNLVESAPATTTMMSSVGNIFQRYQRKIRRCWHRYSHKEDNLKSLYQDMTRPVFLLTSHLEIFEQSGQDDQDGPNLYQGSATELQWNKECSDQFLNVWQTSSKNR